MSARRSRVLLMAAILVLAAAGAGVWTYQATADEHHNTKSDIPKFWWKTPTPFQVQGAQPSLLITWDEASCGPETVATRPTDLGHHLFNVAGLHAPASGWPLDLQLEKASLFWQLGADYYQLTLAWEKDDPATYRMQFVQASRADLADAKTVTLPGQPADRGFDVDTATAYADRLSAHLESLGAAPGARILSLGHSVLNSEGTSEWHSAQFLNGNATTYSGPEFSCRYDFRQNAALCECVKGDGHED